LKITHSITNINNILDLVDFERRGEYFLADVKSATWFFERREYVLADVKSTTWFFEWTHSHPDALSVLV
jgi:hypothetical protein